MPTYKHGIEFRASDWASNFISTKRRFYPLRQGDSIDIVYIWHQGEFSGDEVINAELSIEEQFITTGIDFAKQPNIFLEESAILNRPNNIVVNKSHDRFYSFKLDLTEGTFRGRIIMLLEFKLKN